MSTNRLIPDTEQLIGTLSKSGGTISTGSVKSQAQTWLTRHSKEIESLAAADDRILTKLSYLQSSVHNARLTRKEWLNCLKSIKKFILLTGAQPQNLSFDLSKPFTAYLTLKKMFEGASKEILIYDGYVEEGTLEVLSGVHTSVAVRILTNNTYGNFIRELKIFKRQYKNSEAKKDPAVHDRFFIIDNKAFTSGTSLHSVGGKKYTHIFEAPSSVNSILRTHFNALWKNATTIS